MLIVTLRFYGQTSWMKRDARETYNGTWRANHFVPLMSPPIRNEFDNASQSSVTCCGKLAICKYRSKNLETFFRLLKRRTFKE